MEDICEHQAESTTLLCLNKKRDDGNKNRERMAMTCTLEEEARRSHEHKQAWLAEWRVGGVGNGTLRL